MKVLTLTVEITEGNLLMLDRLINAVPGEYRTNRDSARKIEASICLSRGILLGIERLNDKEAAQKAEAAKGGAK